MLNCIFKKQENMDWIHLPQKEKKLWDLVNTVNTVNTATNVWVE